MAFVVVEGLEAVRTHEFHTRVCFSFTHTNTTPLRHTFATPITYKFTHRTLALSSRPTLVRPRLRFSDEFRFAFVFGSDREKSSYLWFCLKHMRWYMYDAH